jgi:hypothetical protein
MMGFGSIMHRRSLLHQAWLSYQHPRAVLTPALCGYAGALMALTPTKMDMEMVVSLSLLVLPLALALLIVLTL